jgi:hypothetical protein
MENLYGFKKRFSTRAAADNFLRHVTRELTAGGLPHWIEAREEAPGRWSAWVHHWDCKGGDSCMCDAPADDE